MAEAHSFAANIERVGTLYAVAVPAAVSRAVGVRGPVPVLVRVDGGVPFHATLVPSGGGRHRVFVNDEARRGARAGRLSIELEVVSRTREVEVPDDLAAALREADLAGGWALLPPGKREHIIHWIDEAAHDATRAKRVRRAVDEAAARHEKEVDRAARAMSGRPTRRSSPA